MYSENRGTFDNGTTFACSTCKGIGIILYNVPVTKWDKESKSLRLESTFDLHSTCYVCKGTGQIDWCSNITKRG